MRITCPNLKFFLITLLVFLLMVSCRKDEGDVIPDVLVDSHIDLNDPQFASLSAIGNHALVDATTNNLGIYAAGYDGNGIIIYRAQLDEFFAYDRTCPWEYSIDQSSIRINVDGIYAICPECGSNYALPSFGTPVSGPSTYPLKVYKTSFDGRFIHVYNSY